MVEICLFCINVSNNPVFPLNVRDGEGKRLSIKDHVVSQTRDELAVEKAHLRTWF